MERYDGPVFKGMEFYDLQDLSKSNILQVCEISDNWRRTFRPVLPGPNAPREAWEPYVPVYGTLRTFKPKFAVGDIYACRPLPRALDLFQALDVFQVTEAVNDENRLRIRPLHTWLHAITDPRLNSKLIESAIQIYDPAEGVPLQGDATTPANPLVADLHSPNLRQVEPLPNARRCYVCDMDRESMSSGLMCIRCMYPEDSGFTIYQLHCRVCGKPRGLRTGPICGSTYCQALANEPIT